MRLVRGLAPLVVLLVLCLAAPVLTGAAGAGGAAGALVDAGSGTVSATEAGVATSAPLAGPSLAHPIGTDQLGRDLLARVLLGTRTSLLAAGAAVLLTAVIGTVVGLVAGYVRRVEAAAMAVTNLVLAFPGMVVAMALAALVGGGLEAAVVALALTAWPKYARLVRTGVMTVRGSDYVRASRLAGTAPSHVLAWHVAPQVLPVVLVTASLDVGTLMVELAGLSFLGLGAQPPTPELGLMLAQNRSMLLTHPWTVAGPAVAMCVVVAACHLAADAVREAAARPLGAQEVA